MTFQNGTHWEIQWLPDPQVFKATTVKQGDEADQTYLLRPPSDGSTMFVFKAENVARLQDLLEKWQIGDPKTDPKTLERLAASKLITYKNHTRIAGGDLMIVETKDSLDGYSELTGTWDRAVVPPTNDGFPRLMRATVGQGVAVVALDDRVLFFGRHTGKWTQQQVPPELSQKVIPTVGADFAYAKAGTHLYGYNAHVDHVGELNLPPEDAQKVKPELGLKSLTVIVGDKTYALSPKTGKWTSAEDIAEAATNETAEAKADPAMPDIVGVWMFFQGSEPEQKVKITPGEKGGSDNFLMTFQNGTHWEIQWLPDPQVFKATTVKQGDEAEQTYLLRPPSDGKAMFVFKVEDDAKLTNLLDKEKIGDPKRDSIALNQLATGLLRTYKNQTRFTGNDYFIVETPEGLDGYSGSLGIWDRIQVPPRKDEFPRLLSITGGQHVAMVVVDDLLLAYSSRTGKWSRHLIDPEQDETAKPFVGQDLAMVQIGNQIYGFSSSVDSIDALTIPPEYQGKAIAIHGFNSLTIQIGDKTYALSPKTGKWTSAEDITEAATNEKAEVKTKPGMPNIAGLWNRSTQVDGDGFPKISRAKVTDSCDFILRWTAESQGEQLTWKEADQIFEITWEPGKSQASDLIHVSTDGKTLYVFGQIANGERKGLLDRIHHPDISSEKLKAETPNVFDFQDRLVSEEFIIFETDEGLNAFSRITGTWDQMPISLPKDRSPRLTEALGSAHFATTVIDDQLLGYSSQAGKWGRVTIPPESVGKVVPTHSLNIVTAKIGNKTFALSPKTGQWLSPDGKPVSGNDTVTASDQPSEVLVFLAKWSGPCQQIRPMLDSLINEGNPIRLIDVDTNKELTGQYQIKSIPAMVLIRHGRELRRVAGVVTKAQLRQYIDEVRGPDIAAPPTSFSEITPPKSSAKPASPDAKRLAAELWKREAQASAMASEIRELIQKLGPEHREVTESRQQLGETLAAALDLKFQLEQLQISDLQARLSQLEQQIGQRKAQRDKIVQRRAQELIDGDATKWNNGNEPTISTESGNPRRAENPDRQPTGAATSPASTSVHFQGPSSLSVFIPHRSAMLGEGHGCEFPQGPGEFLSYALSLNSQEWKSRISANLDIYSTKDSVRKFVDKHHVWFRVTDEDLDQIASGNSVTKVAYLPQAKLQMLPDAAIETLVSTRLNPQVDPIEEAKRQGEILAVLRFNLPPPDKETPGKAATHANKLSRVPSAEVSLEDYASAEDRCWNELGLKFGEKETVFLGPNDGRYGVEVKEVNDNGPASAAGIRQGYILLGLGQWETRSVTDILWILNHRSPEPTLKAYVYQGVE
ncbi:MAG: thioredoxin domain-containing protein, partial [Planctomycetaceae bacterium]